jgi:hypothetical protein
MRVLGIDVDADLMHRWRGWLMPAAQPYLVPTGLAAELGLADEPSRRSCGTRSSSTIRPVRPSPG